MKLTLKIALVISLFCTTAFAGEMVEGGFAPGDMGEGTFASCGEMVEGGICAAEDITNADNQDDILNFVRSFLNGIFG